MSNIADVLMDAQREREDRDRKLRSALTLGDLRRIVNNITTDRDNVPVVLPNDRRVRSTPWLTGAVSGGMEVTSRRVMYSRFTATDIHITDTTFRMGS